MSSPNALTEIGHFIINHAANSFDQHFGRVLTAIGKEHDSWTGGCDARHMDDSLPCDVYEDRLALAISWLQGRVEDAEVS